MPPLGEPGFARALRAMGMQVSGALNVLRAKVAVAASKPGTGQLQPVLVRTRAAHGSGQHPIHPAAWLRQQKRSFSRKSFRSVVSDTLSSGFRRYFSHASAKGPLYLDRSKFVSSASATARAIGRSTARAPFASALRPNLTGGALPRTAGGYAGPSGLGRGGARFFSHGPAAPAQAIQNASQAMRAFLLQGKRARFEGETGPNGEKRWRVVTAAHEEARSRIRLGNSRIPGSSVDFTLTPTMTAISPLGLGATAAAAATAAAVAALQKSASVGAGANVTTGPASTTTLHSEGFLDALSGDFARAIRDLATTMADLRRLSSLGDLPMSLERGESPRGAYLLRVRFPGADAETVERLCEDAEVQRGVVRQDPDFCAYDEEKYMAAAVSGHTKLRFPYAPQDPLMYPCGSLRSRVSDENVSSSEEDRVLADGFLMDEYEVNPWLAPPPTPGQARPSSGYQSVSLPMYSNNSGVHCSEDFEGLEGIYRFIEECDQAREGRF